MNIGHRTIWFSVWLLVVSTAPASGQQPVATNNPPLRQVSTDEFEIGQVRLNKARRTVTFPAVLNMDLGNLEYLLVTTKGKTHESLLRTEVEPYHIHLAMLFLGARGNTNILSNTNSLTGDSITVDLAWTLNGKERKARAEDLILNIEKQKPMTLGPWIYTGSAVVDGRFIAQSEGNLASIIVDGGALINNPRPGRENDEIWHVHADAIPPLNTAISVTLKLDSRTLKEPATPQSNSPLK